MTTISFRYWQINNATHTFYFFFNTTKIQQKQNQISIIQNYALIKKAARQKAALQKMNQKKYIRIDHKYTFDLSVFYIFEITKI